MQGSDLLVLCLTCNSVVTSRLPVSSVRVTCGVCSKRSATPVSGCVPVVLCSFPLSFRVRCVSLCLSPTQQTGHELYLRDPRASYGLPLDKPLLWKDVVEVARRHGETAIGYTKLASVAGTGSMQLGHGSEPHLGVCAESEVTLAAGDKLVVVALE